VTCKVIIAESFRLAAGGRDEIESSGQTIGACLEEAVRLAPALRKIWFTADGALSKYVILTVNGENLPPRALDRPVREGDEIYPVLLIGGG
jgi:molybdopterin converting factor small subunit